MNLLKPHRNRFKDASAIAQQRQRLFTPHGKRFGMQYTLLLVGDIKCIQCILLLAIA